MPIAPPVPHDDRDEMETHHRLSGVRLRPNRNYACSSKLQGLEDPHLAVKYVHNTTPDASDTSLTSRVTTLSRISTKSFIQWEGLDEELVFVDSNSRNTDQSLIGGKISLPSIPDENSEPWSCDQDDTEEDEDNLGGIGLEGLLDTIREFCRLAGFPPEQVIDLDKCRNTLKATNWNVELGAQLYWDDFFLRQASLQLQQQQQPQQRPIRPRVAAAAVAEPQEQPTARQRPTRQELLHVPNRPPKFIVIRPSGMINDFGMGRITI